MTVLPPLNPPAPAEPPADPVPVNLPVELGAAPVPQTDVWTVRIVVLALAVLAIAGVAAVAYLLDQGIPSDRIAVLVALVGPAVGGLTALLATTRSVPAA